MHPDEVTAEADSAPNFLEEFNFFFLLNYVEPTVDNM